MTGLDEFNLTPASFARLRGRRVTAYVYLKTYRITPVIRRLPPSKRLPYMAARANRWLQKLIRLHPELSFEQKNGTGRKRGLPQPVAVVTVRGPAVEILKLNKAAGVDSLRVVKISGIRRRRSSMPRLRWYCVRAFVVIRVEVARFGMQSTEDRFVLVRANSFEDAKKRLEQQWKRYAEPYLNSDGAMVSWTLDKIVDVYDTYETEIEPSGTEVYSKLGQRKMRPKYVWRTKSPRVS